MERTKQNSLEESLLQSSANPFYYTSNKKSDYLPTFSANSLDKDYDSGARIMFVSPSQLPEGVLGMYHPSSHTITMANNLSSYQQSWVKAHESTHAQGIIDEALTDARAGSNKGYSLRLFGESGFWNGV